MTLSRVLLACGVSLVALGVARYLSLRHERIYGPHYRQQIQAWQASEPQIKPLRLPKVRELKGEKVTRWALLSSKRRAR